MFFIQDLIHPYRSFQSLSTECFPDLSLPSETKDYILQFLVLNCFFDIPKTLLQNLGMAYFTVKQYFINKDHFLVIDDPNGEKLTDIVTHIREQYRNFNLQVPFTITQPTNIVQKYEDLFDNIKFINTCIFLVRQLCNIDVDTIVSKLETITL
jgi:hypothetical protein